MTWQIDSAHSHIQFTVRHMMISKVRGFCETFSGTVDFDEDNPTNSAVDLSIDAASLNTNAGDRDKHLRSADFFDVEKYPTITFKSKRVEQKDADHGKIIGDLTIRDITNEVTLDVEFLGRATSPWGVESLGFTGSTTINRKDWDLTWNAPLESGGFLVGDKIKIDIELELMNVPEPVGEAVAA